ncbi:hypothetical protein [Dactylosporangium sp. CA-139066]|uniref:hypothetical protein n=1 Tax=Dactylosporangium sp. CA-139066 TaxID=3239930 RepID=UPI003D91D003
MKVKAKKKTTVTLTLSHKEARLLLGLADFPEHYAQKPRVTAFLETLAAELADATDDYDTDAETAGYVNSVSF